MHTVHSARLDAWLLSYSALDTSVHSISRKSASDIDRSTERQREARNDAHLRRASRASKTAPDSVLARAWPSVISATRAPKPSVLTLSPHDDACGRADN